jgi:hypothetical protein
MKNDPARGRFVAIQAMRWLGIAFVVAGLLTIRGRILLPIEAGYVLVVVGLVDALVMPIMLARRWRSPPR